MRAVSRTRAAIGAAIWPPVASLPRLPPRSTITLKPRGYHLLLKGLMAPLIAGAKVPVVLTFEKAGTRTVEMDVQAPGLVGEDVLNEKV